MYAVVALVFLSFMKVGMSASVSEIHRLKREKTGAEKTLYTTAVLLALARISLFVYVCYLAWY